MTQWNNISDQVIIRIISHLGPEILVLLIRLEAREIYKARKLNPRLRNAEKLFHY